MTSPDRPPELDDPGIGRLVEHLVVDYVGGVSRDHIEDLFNRALGVNRRQAYLSILLTCSLTAQLIRATLADVLSAAEALAAESLFALEVRPRPGVDMDAPEIRAKRTVMQTITAQLNDDRETAAALVMALVKSDEGPALCPYALAAALDVFAGSYLTDQGRAAWIALGNPPLTEPPDDADD